MASTRSQKAGYIGLALAGAALLGTLKCSVANPFEPSYGAPAQAVVYTSSSPLETLADTAQLRSRAEWCWQRTGVAVPAQLSDYCAQIDSAYKARPD